MKDVGRFLRLLTHDLQNQLGALDLNLQVIPSLVRPDDPTLLAIEPFLGRAAVAAADLNDMLVDVQVFARLISAEDDGASVPTASSRIDLTLKVQDCALTLASSALARGIELKADCAPDVTASGLPEDVRRALKILVVDALRGSFPGTVVSVSCHYDSSEIPVVEVATTQEGLFEPKRQTLARFLAEQLLSLSQVRIDFVNGPGRSSLKLSFQP